MGLLPYVAMPLSQLAHAHGIRMTLAAMIQCERCKATHEIRRGALIVAALYLASKREEIECTKCGHKSALTAEIGDHNETAEARN